MVKQNCVTKYSKRGRKKRIQGRNSGHKKPSTRDELVLGFKNH